LRINGQIFIVTEHKHVKPGKGGAFVRAKLKNIKTQQVLDKVFKPAEKLEDVMLDERKLQFQYRSDNSFHFMDCTSYEEMIISEDVLGGAVKFLQDNLKVTGVCFDEEVLQVILPIISPFQHKTQFWYQV